MSFGGVRTYARALNYVGRRPNPWVAQGLVSLSVISSRCVHAGARVRVPSFLRMSGVSLYGRTTLCLTILLVSGHLGSCRCLEVVNVGVQILVRDPASGPWVCIPRGGISGCHGHLCGIFGGASLLFPTADEPFPPIGRRATMSPQPGQH